VGSKPSSIRSARSHLNVHILPHFGKRGLDEIGVQAQQFFVTKLAQANLSRKMILNVLSHVGLDFADRKRLGLCMPDGGLQEPHRSYRRGPNRS